MFATIGAVFAVEEAHQPNVIVPSSAELFWGAVSFLVLFFILSKYAFPSLQKMLVERTANIEGKLEQAERERVQAHELLELYRAQLGEARAESQRMIVQARANADRLEAELRAKAEDQADRIIERARATIQAERDRAIVELRHEVGSLAVELATRVVGDSLDRQRQLRLVDQYINELDTGGFKVPGEPR